MKISRASEKPGFFDDSFVSRLSSNQKLSKLEANRLEIRWKKICDHEKRSKERNRELLQDFERVEQHAAMLAVKTERLKTYKQQYENYINKMYPRWREDLENYRLSQQQSKNGQARTTSSAPLLLPQTSTRFAAVDPRHVRPLPSHLTSTPGAMYNRSPLETHYSGNLHSGLVRDPHGEFSYQGRHSELSHMHDADVPQTRYSHQTGSRWETPSFYESHRHFDNRAYQSQVASNIRESDDVYERSPHHHLVSSSGQFYDGRPPSGEVSRNFPPDTQYMQPEFSRGQSQHIRPAAPYEPRTELQRSYLGPGAHQAPYDQSGPGGHYYNGRQSGYYGDQRPAEFAPRRMERDVSGRDDPLVEKFESGFPTRAGMESGHDTIQDANHLPPTNQPFVPPEKPLERNIPTSSFPEPSLSSTFVETSMESSDARRNEIQEDVSVSPPSTSQPTPPKPVVKDKEAGKPEKEYVLKHQSLPSEGTEVSVKSRELEVEPGKSPGMTATTTSKLAAVPEGGLRESPIVESEDANMKDMKGKGHAQPGLQGSNELKEDELSDEDESLDLSDLSLPDGNEHYVPSALQKEQKNDSKLAKEENRYDADEDLEVSAGHSKPAFVPDATKSITEDISEDIPESVALDESEDHRDLPVYGEGDRTLLSNIENVSKQPKGLHISSDVDERKKGANEVLHRDDVEKDESGALHKDDVEKDTKELLTKDETEVTAQVKAEEEKEPSVSVDGFLTLLQAVDGDVEVSFSSEALYHSPQCSPDMREEIVRAAEVGSSLQSFDPNTVSMIVLEELPLLVSSFPAGCLIPDRVFTEGVSIRSQKELRPYMESSLVKLWKSLFSHLVNVVTNNVMRAEEVGNMFGSLLIFRYSSYRKESQLLLCRILEAAVSDVSGLSNSPPPADDLDLEPRFEAEAPYNDDVSIASEGSSSTLGSTPPKVQPIKSNEEDRKTTPEPTLSAYEDDFEDDVPLTETAAYQKMMSSAHSEPDDDISDILGNSGPQKEESEADDDVERELARSISPPVTSPRTKSPSQSKSGKPKPKLSLFATGAATADEKPDNKDLGDSWGGSSAKSVKSDISDSESGLSPPSSPDGGLGYIPTMLDTKDQQQAGVKDDKENEKSEPKSANDSKAKRKTDFWNNSDTESEVDLQLSTGGLDQDDDDDFDFYG